MKQLLNSAFGFSRIMLISVIQLGRTLSSIRIILLIILSLIFVKEYPLGYNDQGTTIGWVGLGCLGWVGLGWDGLGWDGLGWDGMGWDGMGWVGLGWDGMGWVGLGWVGMGWDGLGWVGMGWVGLGNGWVKRKGVFGLSLRSSNSNSNGLKTIRDRDPLLCREVSCENK